MCRLRYLTVALLLGNADCFSPMISSSSISLTTMTMVPDGPAGSFFHQVPGEDNGDGKDNKQPVGDINMDQAINEIIKQRKSAPLASQPSTINGVPTSKATGVFLIVGVFNVLVTFYSSFFFCVFFSGDLSGIFNFKLF